jgi:hypothetical protein
MLISIQGSTDCIMDQMVSASLSPQDLRYDMADGENEFPDEA